MTAPFRLAALELRRLGRSRRGRVALAALAAVPLLCGGLYLWACWDPAARLDHVPVALVDDDRPATTAGRTVQAGRDLEQHLRAGRGGFDWHVTDAADAAQGLDEGRYHLVVTVPADFSASLASVSGDDPQAAVLTVRTRDADGSAAAGLARAVLDDVRRTVATGATRGYLENVYVSLAGLHDDLGRATDDARGLAAGAGSAHGGADRVAGDSRTLAADARRLTAGAAGAATSTSGLAARASALDAGLGDLHARAARLPAQTRAVADAAARVAATAGRASAATAQLSAVGADLDGARAQARQLAATVGAYAAAHPDDAAAQQLAADAGARVAALDTRLGAARTRVRTASARTASLAAPARRVARSASALASTAPSLARDARRSDARAHALAAGLRALAGDTRSVTARARALDGAAARTARTATALAAGLTTLDDGASRLAGDLSASTGQVPADTAGAAAARAGVAADPVGLRADPAAGTVTRGEGLAPAAVPLALWIGALATSLLLRPLGSRSLAGGAPAPRVAVAGWLPATALGLVQAGALLALLRLGLGLGTAHPWELLAFLVVVAATFAALLQWVTAQFGLPGRLAALVLLALQLAVAEGVYPIETAPAPLRWMHPLLPTSYVAAGLRQVLATGSAGIPWHSAAVLAAFGAAALAATTWTARRRCLWTVARLHPELTG